MDRVAAVEAALDAAIDTAAPAAQRLAPDAPVTAGSRLTASQALAAFEDQILSRTLDVVARELRTAGVGYYTISSAGHEDDVALGALTRPSDPAFLHYRSGAFVMARARRAGAEGQVRDIVHSLMASRLDPVARGRHKVWGSRERWIVPQTSTIASQLPKAVGTAVALGRRRSLAARPHPAAELPDDALVVASFGDASLNHATALSALNAARWAHRMGAPVPLVLVCEDNGLGISVPTPGGWVRDTVSGMSGLRYVAASGSLPEVWEATAYAVETARGRRAPVFLHLETVRLWGHAGSDVETAYRSRAQIDADEARDPVLRTARWLLSTGVAEPSQLRTIVDEVRDEVRAVADEAVGSGHLDTAEDVMAPLTAHRPDEVRAELAARRPDAAERRAWHRRGLPEHAEQPGARTLAAHLNAALRDLLLERPELVVFGEDVARKGGVYGVTAGLGELAGSARVFDTLLDETSILGLAQGLGLLGYLPVPEIQYLAYLHNALDQLRGEACSTGFFSDGAFTTPMVVRIAGLAYQRGFGGHFHNDDSIGALRDIPGLAIAVPSRGDDAVRMLRAATAMAAVDARVTAFVEPIALYHTRDLHEAGDGGWLTEYPPAGEALLPGEVGVYGEEARDVLVVTYGNGVPMALRAARRLVDAGLGARVIDLRWLAPLPLEAVREHAAACDAVVVADECRASGGGVADALVAALAESGYPRPIASVRSRDSYVPLGPSADTVLLGEDDVVAAVRRVAVPVSPTSPIHRLTGRQGPRRGAWRPWRRR